MKCRVVTAICAIGVILLAGLTAVDTCAETVTKTFAPKKAVRINTVSGDCVIKRGGADQIEVVVDWSYRPRDSFEPQFRERENVLRLDEDMYGSNSGHSTWTLTVPESTEVRFESASGGLTAGGVAGELTVNTASGDIDLDGCSGELDINTASGDISAVECNGELRLNTASGRVEVQSCRGEFDLNAASGRVRAIGVTVEGVSTFNAASGSVLVELAATPEHDIRLSSASGRATLDYSGHPIKGHFEFLTRYRSGDVSCPFDFDQEDRVRKWGDRYDLRSFTRGGETPEIVIETGSGSAILRE